MNKLLWAIFSACLIILSQGCSSDGIIGSHSWEIKDHSFWQVAKVCGYAPCQQVAALKGDDIYIRVESSIGAREDKLLTVQLTFEPNDGQYAFDPSLTVATLDDNSEIKAKARGCNTTEYQTGHYKEALRSAGAVTGVQQLKQYGCFILFFDTERVLKDIPFSMEINGLTKSGQPVMIPRLYFSKKNN
jgi:hypothetical protein